MASITELLNLWTLALRAERASKATILAYEVSVRQFVEWRGGVDVSEVTRADVRRWLGYLEEEQGRSPATLRTRYGGLRQFFAFLVDEGELDLSPVEGVKAPKVVPPKVNVLTEEQAKRLVNIQGRDFTSRRDSAILRLFCDTGMRAGEMLGLKVEDVDVANGVVHVIGKGSRERASAFGDRTAKALAMYLLSRKQHEMAHLPDMWLGQRGPLQRNGLRQMVKRRGRAAGVPELYPHMLRHTFADHWLGNGGQEGDLMALAGWSSRQMLDRYGASNRANRAREAHRRLALGDRL